jgi:hypothetical protein
MVDYEKLGLFYLGRTYDLERKARKEDLVLYDSRDLVTHAVCVGMTGSGKTGLCLDLLEEAAIDGIPAIVIDPKGDLGDLLLTFPDLRPADFRPWINEDDARRKGLDPDAFASAEAERWAKGLAEWNQDGARIRKLREAADMVIYTPGSQAGIPVSVLESFAPPPTAVVDDADLMRERITTTATSLLGLLGIDADPIKSREHILLSTLFDTAWRAGQSLDMATLIRQIQSPPVSRIGVLDLETFFPAKERFALAMSLNNLLAAPGFSSWLDGEPLDLQHLLYTSQGKPRVAIFSIAHLNDTERMFFVSLLLNQALGWMRTLPGTTSLRALLYMDEIAGYLPPTANPPSKPAMLTLLKQARAFGLGIVLATQNPVDLDYKALSNAGTWFIGRLQTERDQLRVLDGLEGASSSGGGAFDRQAMGRMLAALGSRVFLMHNVHEDAPQIFESRWAMSYLSGPLTRAQIKTLMDPRRAEFASGAGQAAPGTVKPVAAGSQPAASAAAAASSTSRPVLPPAITEYFAPAPGPAAYHATLLGAAQVRFTDAKTKIDETRTVTAVTPITSDAVAVDWSQSTETDLSPNDLLREPPVGATFGDLPAAAQKASSYAAWSKAFTAWIAQKQSLDLLRSDLHDVVSKPGESERDFRVRLGQAAREGRDDEVARVRQKYAPKLAALQERLRRSQQAVTREEEQASASKMQTAISFGTTVIGAFLGRKTFSAATLGRASTAARGVSRSMKESSDVARAQESVSAVQAQIQELDAALQAEIAGIEASHAASNEPLTTLSIKPKRTGIQVQLVALTWMPDDKV